MATRNITSQLLRLRKEIHEESKLLKYQSNVKDRLLLQSKESFASSSNQMEEAPVPQWLSCVNQMKDKRLAIHQNIDLLQKLYEKRFRVIFSETDLVRLDEEIEHKVHLIVALFKDMEKLLKSIQPNASMSEERRKLHQNIWLGNYHALKDLQSKFKQLQKAHLQYLLTEKSVEDSSPIGRILSSRDEVTDDMSTVSFTDTGLTPHQLVQVQNTEEMVHLRDSKIEQISKSVQDLASIFQELAVMVRHQGTLLDRIDFNLEHAVVLVEDGEKQVVKAEKHQKQASSCTNTIIGLELAIAAMTGLLIWKETRAH